MKMLMFDFRDSEKKFFKNNEFPDFDITFIPEPLNEMSKLTREQYEETDVISVFISSNLTEDVLSKFKNLRVVATRSTGYNHIDVKYCSQHNIAVFNVEEYGQTSVAQFTFGLILALVRNLFPAYLDIQKKANEITYGIDTKTIEIKKDYATNFMRIFPVKNLFIPLNIVFGNVKIISLEVRRGENLGELLDRNGSSSGSLLERIVLNYLEKYKRTVD